MTEERIKELRALIAPGPVHVTWPDEADTELARCRVELARIMALADEGISGPMARSGDLKFQAIDIARIPMEAIDALLGEL